MNHGDNVIYRTVQRYGDMSLPSVAEWSQIYYLDDPVEGLRRLRAGKSLLDLIPAHMRQTTLPTEAEKAAVGPPERPTEKRKKRDDGWVYFFQAGPGGPIKIGITATVHHRFVNTQVGCPVRLLFLGAFPGNGYVENELQYEFGPYRFRGEWYWAHPLLIERIAALTLNVEQPPKMKREWPY